jgi:hypothetical protein
MPEWDFSLTVDDVLRGQGAEPTMIRARRPSLLEVAEWALHEGLPLLQPAVLAQELSIKEIRHERLIFEEGGFISGSLISQHLRGATEIVVLLCTIGPQLEAISAELIQTDSLHALALEGFGTAAVESLANQACARIEKQAQAKAMQASIPLSPGMIGWPVEVGQKQIFSLLNASSIGVSLNDNAMMIPRLSLSQVIGIGLQLNFQGRTCDFCSLKETCRYQHQ